MSDSPGNREVAHRVFAAEYDDADLDYSESDEERAPNYVITPTGARSNRLFLVGVLTEIEPVNEEMLRARFVDPTGAFVVYAGQYQPDALAFLESAEPPAFVSVTGKARTFSPDDSDRVYTSVRPESVTEVDAETRDRWVVDAAEHTLARVATFGAALDSGLRGERLRTALDAAGADPGLAAGVPLALDHYGTTEGYLARIEALARDALRQVAGEIDEVGDHAGSPDDPAGGTVDPAGLADAVPLAVVDLDAEDAAAAVQAGGAPEDGGEPSASEPDAEASTGAASGTGASAGSADAEPTEGATAAESASADAGSTAASAEEAEASGTSADPPADESTADESAAESTTGGPEESGTATDGIGEFDAGEGEGADDVGDFEPGESLEGRAAEESATATAAGDGTAEEVGDPPEEVLDDDERERIEEEFGTDFSSGTEVDEPGEAGIEPEAGDVEPPEDDEASDEPGAAEAADATAEEPAADSTGDESATDTGTADDSTADEPADEQSAADDAAAASEDVDLDEALMEKMAAMDDDGGADRGELVDRLVDAHGVSEDEVEAAIDDALMNGKCYEPADGKLTPI